MHAEDRPKPPRERDPASRRLALARDLIQRKRRPEALGLLAALAPAGAPAARKAKVAALIGDYEFKRGRFADAAAYQAGALGQLSAAEPRDWFRPALGQVRALLARPDVDAAYTAALAAWVRAQARVQEFSAQTNVSLATLRARKRIVVGPRPLRTSVVASRLGEAFQQAGEWEMAEFFFHEALGVNPNGACRARQALARIALSDDRPADAEARAREALLVGKTQAKTVSAWPLLIEARARQKKPLLTAENRAALKTIKTPAVRARAVLVICKALRARQDDAWMSLATEWVAKDGARAPAIRYELEKLFLAEARLAGAHTRAQAATALQLARSADAAPYESISAAKAYVRTSLLARESTPSWRNLGQQIERRHNAKVARRALHAMALGAMEAKRLDLATQILAAVCAATPRGHRQWGRSISALGRMQRAGGHHSAACSTYLQMSANPLVERRFRAQALLLAVRCATEGGIDAPVGDLAWFEQLLRTETDHRTLLDLGRKLRLAPASFAPLKTLAIDRGTELAEAELAGIEHPAPALTLLLELNRRQYFDFGQSTRVLAQFESYAKPRLDWLWSAKLAFWEWYSIVVLSTDRRHGVDVALACAGRYLDDPGTPPDGLALLATETGRVLVEAKRIAAALVQFRRATVAQPTAPHVALAYYWQALAAWKQGDKTTAYAQADAVRRCFGRKPAFFEHWRLDSRAALLLADLNVDAVLTSTDNLYKPPFVAEQRSLITADLETL